MEAAVHQPRRPGRRGKVTICPRSCPPSPYATASSHQTSLPRWPMRDSGCSAAAVMTGRGGALPRRDVAEAEHHATFLQEVVITYVPGLLQTPDYARAVFGYMRPELPESELRPRVEHRMQRRAVIEGDAPTPYETIVHEFALRVRVADRQTLLAQLLAEIRAGVQGRSALVPQPAISPLRAAATKAIVRVAVQVRRWIEGG